MHVPVLQESNNKLTTLIENRTTYLIEDAELNIFETHQVAESVRLNFASPTLATMLQGKKIMTLSQNEPFAFLPGESLFLPANEQMKIDFPEASSKQPTKCLAMVVSEEKMASTAELMNDKIPKSDGIEWELGNLNLHFSNDWGMTQILNRLIFLFTENHPNKEQFVDMAIRELLMRIVQTETTQAYLSDASAKQKKSRIAYIIQYIKNNLSEKLTVKELSEKAYMSNSTFYRTFKNEIGVSPIDFINTLRLGLASNLLQESNKSVQEIYMQCGFNSLSYFYRLFKKQFSMTPCDYQQMMNREKS